MADLSSNYNTRDKRWDRNQWKLKPNRFALSLIVNEERQSIKYDDEDYCFDNVAKDVKN